MSGSGSYDVTVVGGGVIGTSIALHTAAMAAGKLRVAVIERDATYQYASAPRSAGGIRQQFSMPENVQLSMYGAQFIKSGLAEMCRGLDVDTDVQFRENGYLILASEAGEAQLRENNAMQHRCGADWVKLMTPDQLKARFPWMNIDGLSLGSFGEQNEGYFDPWALLQAMKKAAMARGVEFITGEVTGVQCGGGGKIDSVKMKDGSSVSAGTIVNAAGPFGGQVVDFCGNVTPLPVRPRKRCMWLFKIGSPMASDGVTPAPCDNTPLMVDPSGVYFRSEGHGGRFVCGVSPLPTEDPDICLEDLESANEELFMERIWPALYERVPALESLKVESSWAGMYEYNTLDQNGVVGYHTDVSNLLLCSGFSGHGLQHAPGVGRACAELLVHGKFQTIDLSVLSFERIVNNAPVFEKGIY